MKKISVLFLFFILLIPAVCSAGTFQVDLEYSKVRFRIQYILGYVLGAFPQFDGTIVLNDDNTALVSVSGTVDVAKLDTRLPERDEDLRSEKFFDAAKFPEAKFATTKISKGKLTADLTLKGITKSVPFDYEFFGTAKDQSGNNWAALTLKGKINRKDFGMDRNMKTDDGKMLLGDEVEFRIELHGMLK